MSSAGECPDGALLLHPVATNSSQPQIHSEKLNQSNSEFHYQVKSLRTIIGVIYLFYHKRSFEYVTDTIIITRGAVQR